MAKDPKFTASDGLRWLGIPLPVYLKSREILSGRHGNPIESALMAVWDSKVREAMTPAQVLGMYGIDPESPLDAVREYDKERRKYDA